jgi:hypothetical protein
LLRNAPYIRDGPAAARSKTNLPHKLRIILIFARFAERNLGPGEIESKQSGVYVPGLSQLVWLIGLMAGNKLGLPFCGSGSPVHGCSTIGLAHSRNLLVSAAAHYLFKITTRSLCQMRHPIALLLANTGPWLRSEKLRSQKTTPGGEFCPTDVYMLRGR